MRPLVVLLAVVVSGEEVSQALSAEELQILLEDALKIVDLRLHALWREGERDESISQPFLAQILVVALQVFRCIFIHNWRVDLQPAVYPCEHEELVNLDSLHQEDKSILQLQEYFLDLERR